MPPVHRNQDDRFCTAKTIVTGQSSVFINNILSAVEGDRNTHNNLGALISASPGNVFIEGKKLIVAMMDQSAPDQIGAVTHVTNFPTPQKGSTNTFAYGGSGSFAGGLGTIVGGNLLNGEMVSMLGNVIGQVQNFTNLGSGSGLAIIKGLNNGQLNSIPGVGSVITGMTSGNSFNFSSIQS